MKKITAMLAATILLAACGGSAADESSTSIPPGGPRVNVGDPISVADALQADASTPVLVEGYLFVLEDGTVVLADAIAESYPPQPGGATIVVEGLSTEGMALEMAPEDSELATIKWSNDPYGVLGTVQGGVLIHFDDPGA